MSGRAVREMCLNPLTRRPRAVPCLARLDIEGDPFGGPVAKRLGVGGSWSTVGRTRLGLRGTIGSLAGDLRHFCGNVRPP